MLSVEIPVGYEDGGREREQTLFATFLQGIGGCASVSRLPLFRTPPTPLGTGRLLQDLLQRLKSLNLQEAWQEKLYGSLFFKYTFQLSVFKRKQNAYMRLKQIQTTVYAAFIQMKNHDGKQLQRQKRKCRGTRLPFKCACR